MLPGIPKALFVTRPVLEIIVFVCRFLNLPGCNVPGVESWSECALISIDRSVYRFYYRTHYDIVQQVSPGLESAQTNGVGKSMAGLLLIRQSLYFMSGTRLLLLKKRPYCCGLYLRVKQ